MFEQTQTCSKCWEDTECWALNGIALFTSQEDLNSEEWNNWEGLCEIQAAGHGMARALKNSEHLLLSA